MKKQYECDLRIPAICEYTILRTLTIMFFLLVCDPCVFLYSAIFLASLGLVEEAGSLDFLKRASFDKRGMYFFKQSFDGTITGEVDESVYTTIVSPRALYTCDSNDCSSL